jgi:hypothetical protein
MILTSLEFREVDGRYNRNDYWIALVAEMECVHDINQFDTIQLIGGNEYTLQSDNHTSH